MTFTTFRAPGATPAPVLVPMVRMTRTTRAPRVTASTARGPRGRLRVAAAMLAAVALSGCDLLPFWPKPELPLSEKAVATRDAPPGLVFRGTLAGAPVHLLVHDCEVFSVTPVGPRRKDGGQEVEWTSLAKPEMYPFFNFCVRQGMTVDNGVVTVDFGRQAFGAGGCCATRGTFRSQDGRNWKKVD